MSTRCVDNNPLYSVSTLLLLITTGWVAALLWQRLSDQGIALLILLGLLLAILRHQLQDQLLSYSPWHAAAAPKPNPAAPTGASSSPRLPVTSSSMQGSTPSSRSPMPEGSSRCLHRELTTKGSNQYARRWTCLACGAVFKGAPPSFAEPQHAAESAQHPPTEPSGGEINERMPARR